VCTGSVQQGRDFLCAECLNFPLNIRIPGVDMGLGEHNVLEIERTHGFEWQLPQLEVASVNQQKGTVLRLSLTVTQRCRHRAAWLRYVEVLRAIPRRLNQTLVFVAPHNEIEKIVEKLLRNVVRLAMSHAVLMYHKQTEPFVGMFARS